MGTRTTSNYNSWRNIQFRLCFTLFTLLQSPLIILARNTVTANTPLSGDQTIVSANQTFELGFYQPGSSSNYYIAMWYKNITKRTPVWVANRDQPVSDKHSSQLKIIDGNLVITATASSSSPIWSTNLTTTGSSSIEAILLDSGNLVLIHSSKANSTSTSSNYLWQSFDHPAHTWLPGSKLGLNKLTKKTQLLTSWKNSEDPATGLFSLELDPNGTSQYLIFWNNSEQYWSSGPWDDQHKIFSLVPEMRLNYIYNFSYIDNVNESYFIYSVYDPSYISRFVIDVSGQIKQYTWLNDSQQWNLFWSQPRQQCEVYAFCGAFGSCNQISPPFCNCLQGFQPKSNTAWGLNDHSGGCRRKTALSCGNTSGKDSDRFRVYPNMELPVNPAQTAASSSEECASTCLKNCSCTAYAYSGESANGCSIWIGDLLNLKQHSDDDDASGTKLYLRLAASEFTTKSNSKLHIGIIVGAIAGLLLLFMLIATLIYCRKKRRRSVGSAKTMEGSLVAFGFKDLQIATKNFSEKLGGGGFGSVFKGTLPDSSSLIAVKKLESINQGEKQFRTEVSTIGTIQHVNLVRLRGFCSEGSNKLLVYDFMPNSSLDTLLFREESEVLDWNTRFQVALGTARGLTYLHEKCRDCIIHCDIKPENILLDGEFCPKVADFGLAKLVGRDFSRVLTTMRGTRGYLAPEWISGVAITAKADVYSYGMMLFELVSGRRNTEQSEDGKIKFFPTWAASKITQGEEDVLSIVDPRLEGKADPEEVLKICKLGCWCIQDDENRRPTMGQVVQILEGVLDVNMPPLPRSLQVFAESQEHVLFFTESSSGQSSESQGKSSNTNSTSLSSQKSRTYVSGVSTKSEE